MKNNDLLTKKDFDEKLKNELADKELTISMQAEKINELKSEIIKTQKEKDIIDARELEVGKTIEKYKNRAHYLEKIIDRRLDIEITRLQNLFELIERSFDKFSDFGKNELTSVIQSLLSLKDEVNEVHLASKEKVALNNNSGFDDLEERYHKLINLYELTKVEAGDKKRGRPKKEPETIETFLKRKKAENDKKKQTQFDLDEALNPVDSLENIMGDILKKK